MKSPKQNLLSKIETFLQDSERHIQIEELINAADILKRQKQWTKLLLKINETKPIIYSLLSDNDKQYYILKLSEMKPKTYHGDRSYSSREYPDLLIQCHKIKVIHGVRNYVELFLSLKGIKQDSSTREYIGSATALLEVTVLSL